MQYIDKAALVAEIARLQATTMDEDGNFYTAKAQAEYNVLCMLDSFLDTLEVKEVKSIDAFIKKACELLARMIWEVTYEDLEGNSVQHHDKMEFIENFKNYMKGE